MLREKQSCCHSRNLGTEDWQKIEQKIEVRILTFIPFFRYAAYNRLIMPYYNSSVLYEMYFILSNMYTEIGYQMMRLKKTIKGLGDCEEIVILYTLCSTLIKKRNYF